MVKQLPIPAALAAVFAHVLSTVENFADAFEPDLDAWEALPLARAIAEPVR